jgi:hypothetical protein
LGLPMPAITVKPESPQVAAEIIIDKRGETDSSRYSGLKMGLLDDDAMAEALRAAQTKQKEGLPLRSPIAHPLPKNAFWQPKRSGETLVRE